MHLNMECMIGGEKQSLNSVFQIADITRPLMSVSKICDQGLFCLFGNEKAIIQTAEGKNVCEFQRRGGLYVATMKLKRRRVARVYWVRLLVRSLFIGRSDSRREAGCFATHKTHPFH